MPHHQSKQTAVENKRHRKKINEAISLQALTEKSADIAIGHSQDADRHHELSHERLAKQRGKFEHSEIKE